MPKTIGKYRVVRLLGRGGMGMVYEGRDEALERSVAIKLITPELCLYPEVYDRFRTEARAAARLNHPNIVNVYEFGDDVAEPYLVMEFVEGQDLSSLIKQKGPLQAAEVVGIVRQCALALSKATIANLVHRDIKPSNLLLTKDGVVKVMDFGLSKLLDSGTSLTNSGAMMGTPDYMSPEQAKGEKLDFRTDIYSLGCTMYALLAGKKPFHSESLPGMIHQHINSALPIPAAWRTFYQGRLVALMEKMCAKKRENRPQTWDEIVRELDSMTAAGSKPVAESGKSNRWPSGMIIGIVAGLLLALVIGGSMTFKHLRNRRGQRENAAALQPVKQAMENDQSPATVVLQSNDPAPREQSFVLPTPAQTSREEEPRQRPPAGNNEAAEDRPPSPEEELDMEEDRPLRREGERPLLMTAQQMLDHRDARIKAIALASKGDFGPFRSLLTDEMDQEGNPPAPRPVQRVYEGILTILDGTDKIDAMIKQQLNNPNATAAERIAQTHRMIATEGAKMSDEQAWHTLLYLHLLRDSGVSKAFRELAKNRPNFGQTRAHKLDVMIVDNFFQPAIGFPPAGSAQQSQPLRPE